MQGKKSENLPEIVSQLRQKIVISSQRSRRCVIYQWKATRVYFPELFTDRQYLFWRRSYDRLNDRRSVCPNFWFGPKLLFWGPDHIGKPMDEFWGFYNPNHSREEKKIREEDEEIREEAAISSSEEPLELQTRTRKPPSHHWSLYHPRFIFPLSSFILLVCFCSHVWLISLS